MFSNLIQKAYAQAVVGNGTPIGTDALITKILENIVNPIITLMVAVAIIIFLWGVFQFIRNADGSEDRKTGGLHILWGAVGLFLMVTAYGVLNLIIGTIRT